MSGTTRVGWAVLDRECDALDRAMSADARHSAILTVTMKVARLVRGGQLEESLARAKLGQVIRRHDPTRQAELDRALTGALRKADPWLPPEGTAIQFVDRAARQAAAVDWLHDGPCVDDRIARGGSAGATALAVCVFFAARSNRIGSTMLSETYAQIGEATCLDPMTVYRQQARWGRWITQVAKGSKELDKETGEITSTASIWRLELPREGSNPLSPKRPSSAIPSGYSGFDPRVNLDLGNPLHLPWTQRWRRRLGGRNEWRIWLALDAQDEMTQADIVRATGITKNAVRGRLPVMLNAGEIIEAEPGLYMRSLGESIYDDPSVYDESRTCSRCRPTGVAA